MFLKVFAFGVALGMLSDVWDFQQKQVTFQHDAYVDGIVGIQCGAFGFPSRPRLGDPTGVHSSLCVTNQSSNDAVVIQAWQQSKVEDGQEQAAFGAFLDDGPRASGRNLGYYAAVNNDGGGGASGYVAALRGLGMVGFEARFNRFSAGWGVVVSNPAFPGFDGQGTQWSVDRRGVMRSVQMSDMQTKLFALEARVRALESVR